VTNENVVGHRSPIHLNKIADRAFGLSRWLDRDKTNKKKEFEQKEAKKTNKNQDWAYREQHQARQMRP
jgi:hypothetical protein